MSAALASAEQISIDLDRRHGGGFGRRNPDHDVRRLDRHAPWHELGVARPADDDTGADRLGRWTTLGVPTRPAIDAVPEWSSASPLAFLRQRPQRGSIGISEPVPACRRPTGCDRVQRWV